MRVGRIGRRAGEKERERVWVDTGCCIIVPDTMVWEAMWHSGYHCRLSSHRSPVRTRPVVVLPPTGFARPGSGAPPAYASFNHPSVFPRRAASDTVVRGHIGKERKRAQPTAAVRPTTANARWEAATPPVACLCPSRRSARAAARTVGFEPGSSGAGVQGASTAAPGAAPLLGDTSHTAGATNKHTSARDRKTRKGSFQEQGCPTSPCLPTPRFAWAPSIRDQVCLTRCM